MFIPRMLLRSRRGNQRTRARRSRFEHSFALETLESRTPLSGGMTVASGSFLPPPPTLYGAITLGPAAAAFCGSALGSTLRRIEPRS